MASFGTHLSLFFLLALLLSPQIQAREGKFYSLFSHFTTKEPQVVLEKAKTPAPAQAPTTTMATEPALAPEFSSVAPGPAPEAFFVDKGDGYGLYGTDPTEYSPTKETPTSYTNFENELLNEDLNGESYKKGYPKFPPPRQSNYNNEMLYRNNYDSYGYKKNYVDNSYSNNAYDQYHVNHNNQLNNGKREGMSDTRFVENGRYYHDVNNENVKGYESRSGNTENEFGYFDKNKYPNEYNTMEEYEKEQQSQRYIP
ncbi:hypothetical protein L6164_018672 [Bauhinia variegata]|uniref:Uncharacterized protein n=1 Tax=Bauhinia variegata TaxID=167791 RepID=A0ACB9NCG8_BAUVA|nr:hypothetical protein L6164_018672 [Bauhinia variegata]